MKRYAVIFCLIISTLAREAFCQKGSTMQSGSVAVEKAEIYYDVAGNGNAVILIHAGLLTKEMWDGTFEKLASQYRVVRYDLRNHGKSRSEVATFSHFSDLNALMEGLKIDKAAFMGLSLGGKVAIDFSLQYPDKVNGLILVSTGLSGFKFHGRENQAYDEKFNAAAQKGDPVKMIEAFMEAWVYGPHRKAEQIDPAVRNKISNMARESLGTYNIDTKELISDPTAITRLSDIKKPALAIVGDLDMPNVIEIASLLEQNIPRLQKVTILGAAHMVNLEKPQEFNKAVQFFLNSVYK